MCLYVCKCRGRCVCACRCGRIGVCVCVGVRVCLCLDGRDLTSCARDFSHLSPLPHALCYSKPPTTSASSSLSLLRRLMFQRQSFFSSPLTSPAGCSPEI